MCGHLDCGGVLGTCCWFICHPLLASLKWALWGWETARPSHSHTFSKFLREEVAGGKMCWSGGTMDRKSPMFFNQFYNLWWKSGSLEWWWFSSDLLRNLVLSEVVFGILAIPCGYVRPPFLPMSLEDFYFFLFLDFVYLVHCLHSYFNSQPQFICQDLPWMLPTMGDLLWP